MSKIMLSLVTIFMCGSALAEEGSGAKCASTAEQSASIDAHTKFDLFKLDTTIKSTKVIADYFFTPVYEVIVLGKVTQGGNKGDVLELPYVIITDYRSVTDRCETSVVKALPYKPLTF